MSKLKSLFIWVLTLSMMMAAMAVTVCADEATDLKSMKVYAVDAAGKKTEVKMNFVSTTYSYDLTVMSDAASISIEAEPQDSTSTWSIEKDGINTKMDFGTNLTVVNVKSAAGAVQKYTLNTTRLTEAEQATYKEEETDENSDNTDSKSSNTVVKAGKKEFNIASSFDENLIPEGFKKSEAEYDGKTYPCIRGEVKDLIAFYLKNDEEEGFYILNSENNKFEKMHNIKIKSRMYTVVTPKKVDACLKNYEKKTVKIIDEEVKTWILNEEQGMYLVYAMNWNGDTSLYCYDDNEKCFQRYLVENDSNTQMTAANKAYENLQNKYNNLVSKYNVLLKVLCGLVILIIILIFVIINMALNKKEKKARKEVEQRIEEGVIDIPDFVNASKAENVEEEVTKAETLDNFDRTYGDEPTFGIDDEEEGFYGGEVESEDDVLIDITDDEEIEEETQDIEDKTKEVQLEAEEDLKATLKSMLPDEEDDDDDDFEFIDLN